METTSDLGTRLRKLRKIHSESLVTTAQAISTDRAYLNKIELGTIKPSKRLLDKILVHFSVEGNNATILRQLAGHIPLKVALVDDRKDQIHMANLQPAAPIAIPPQPAQINVNPAQTPVLYTDSVIVTTSEFGLVLDVAQAVGGGMQQTIVSRIGMSFEHARRLIATMQDNLDKNER